MTYLKSNVFCGSLFDLVSVNIFIYHLEENMKWFLANCSGSMRDCMLGSEDGKSCLDRMALDNIGPDVHEHYPKRKQAPAPN